MDHICVIVVCRVSFFVVFCCFLGLLCFTGEMGCDRIKELLQNRYYLLPCVMKAVREYLSDKFI